MSEHPVDQKTRANFALVITSDTRTRKEDETGRVAYEYIEAEGHSVVSHSIIPMCHNIPIDSVTTDFTMAEAYIEAHCRVDATYKTGVEMEALTGVTVALLTIWDMVKYIEKDENGQYPDTRISEI